MPCSDIVLRDDPGLEFSLSKRSGACQASVRRGIFRGFQTARFTDGKPLETACGDQAAVTHLPRAAKIDFTETPALWRALWRALGLWTHDPMDVTTAARSGFR